MNIQQNKDNFVQTTISVLVEFITSTKRMFNVNVTDNGSIVRDVQYYTHRPISELTVVYSPFHHWFYVDLH